jgi:hypothetical protein
MILVTPPYVFDTLVHALAVLEPGDATLEGVTERSQDLLINALET